MISETKNWNRRMEQKAAELKDGLTLGSRFSCPPANVCSPQLVPVFFPLLIVDLALSNGAQEYVAFVKGIYSDSNNIFLWHELEDINKKKLISKISVDSNFGFSSYAWLCVFHRSHRLLWWKKVLCTGLSVKIALISFWNVLRAPSILHQGVCL